MITGAVLSSTKMVCIQVLELPQSSVALHVRKMVLSWGHAPPATWSTKVMASVGSQSVAVAVPVLTGNVLDVHWMVTFGGQVIVGGVLSSTRIICTQLLVLPQSSVAVQVRVMILSWGHAPPDTTSLEAMVGEPSQLSVAVAVPVLAGKVLAVHWIVIFWGHVIDGATLSSIVMI